MAEKFNRVQRYAPFFGRMVDQMPKLIASGRTPLSGAGLMDVRIEALGLEDGVDDDFKSTWVDNYYDVADDGILYHPDGNRIKLVHEAKALREMNGRSKLLNGALVLDNSAYEVDGLELTSEQLGKMNNGRPLTRQEVNDHEIWQWSARNRDRLREYSGKTFKVAKTRFGYDENMGVYLGSGVKGKLTMRSWVVGGLYVGSGASGRGNLGGGDGRLVGVATESQSAKKK